MIIVVISIYVCTFFIQVINTRCSKKHFHWEIFKKKINYNLHFLTLFKYFIFLLHIFDPNDYV